MDSNFIFDIVAKIKVNLLYAHMKEQGPRRVIFGPVKYQNMNRRKNATSFFICDL